MRFLLTAVKARVSATLPEHVEHIGAPFIALPNLAFRQPRRLFVRYAHTTSHRPDIDPRTKGHSRFHSSWSIRLCSLNSLCLDMEKANQSINSSFGSMASDVWLYLSTLNAERVPYAKPRLLQPDMVQIEHRTDQSEPLRHRVAQEPNRIID